MERRILERKRQDVCSECGRAIVDAEKECPHCGRFPQKAYHERAAAKTLGFSKWVQNSPVMQPNQKLSEQSSETGLRNISHYSSFISKPQS
jgi:hypothetical protein